MKTIKAGQMPEVRRIGGEPRGWGQGVKRGGEWVWPTAPEPTMPSYFDSMGDVLRYHLAYARHSSHRIAAAAGIASRSMDAFMRGDDDAISLSAASQVAQLLGVRLYDQGMIEALLDVYDDAGSPDTSISTPNSLTRWAWRRVATR